MGVAGVLLNGTSLQLETKRLLLRPMLESDLDALLLIFTDPNVMASFGVDPFTHEQMQRWLQRNLDHQKEFGYGLFSVERIHAEGSHHTGIGEDQEQRVEIALEHGTQEEPLRFKL